MQINYLSSTDEALFSDMVHGDTGLGELFGGFMLQLECDTDYDTVMISFDDEDTIRIVVEDSPYVVVMSDADQSIILYVSDYGELEEDGQYDFDDDGAETVVDIIGSRILTRDYDAD